MYQSDCYLFHVSIKDFKGLVYFLFIVIFTALRGYTYKWNHFKQVGHSIQSTSAFEDVPGGYSCLHMPHSSSLVLLWLSIARDLEIARVYFLLEKANMCSLLYKHKEKHNLTATETSDKRPLTVVLSGETE